MWPPRVKIFKIIKILVIVFYENIQKFENKIIKTNSFNRIWRAEAKYFQSTEIFTPFSYGAWLIHRTFGDNGQILRNFNPCQWP